MNKRRTKKKVKKKEKKSKKKKSKKSDKKDNEMEDNMVIANKAKEDDKPNDKPNDNGIQKEKVQQKQQEIVKEQVFMENRPIYFIDDDAASLIDLPASLKGYMKPNINMGNLNKINSKNINEMDDMDREADNIVHKHREQTKQMLQNVVQDKLKIMGQQQPPINVIKKQQSKRKNKRNDEETESSSDSDDDSDGSTYIPEDYDSTTISSEHSKPNNKVRKSALDKNHVFDVVRPSTKVLNNQIKVNNMLVNNVKNDDATDYNKGKLFDDVQLGLNMLDSNINDMLVNEKKSKTKSKSKSKSKRNSTIHTKRKSSNENYTRSDSKHNNNRDSNEIIQRRTALEEFDLVDDEPQNRRSSGKSGFFGRLKSDAEVLHSKSKEKKEKKKRKSFSRRKSFFPFSKSKKKSKAQSNTDHLNSSLFSNVDVIKSIDTEELIGSDKSLKSSKQSDIKQDEMIRHWLNKPPQLVTVTLNSKTKQLNISGKIIDITNIISISLNNFKPMESISKNTGFQLKIKDKNNDNIYKVTLETLDQLHRDKWAFNISKNMNSIGLKKVASDDEDVDEL